MDELDRILLSEPGAGPSAGFTRSVMEAVHAEAAAPPPITFPWRRALPGLVVAAATALAALALGLAELAGTAASGPPAPAPSPAMTWTVTALSGCYLLARMALRAAEPLR